MNQIEKLTEATIKALQEVNEEDIHKYAYNNNFKYEFNNYECIVPATKEVETLANKYNLKYYIHADAEAGPEADDENYYDIIGDLDDLVAFHKEYKASISNQE